MTDQDYATAQVIAWLQHDPLLLETAQHIVHLESSPGDGARSLPEWMRCRMGWCGLNHSSSDIPGRTIPSLYELRKLIPQSSFDNVDWDAVRSAVTEGRTW